MDIGLLYIPRRTAHATIRSESSLFHVPPSSFPCGTSPCKRLPRLMLNSAGEKGNVKFADTSRWCRRQILTSGTRLSKQKSKLKLSRCLIFHRPCMHGGCYLQAKEVFLRKNYLPDACVCLTLPPVAEGFGSLKLESLHPSLVSN